MSARARSLSLCVALLLPASIASLSGCPGGTPPGDDAGNPDGFDDATVPRIDDREAFQAIAEVSPSSEAVKFVVTGFGGDQRIRYLDSGHYTLHDEWYWFRLLNGEPIEHIDESPVHVGRTFATVQDIYEWAHLQASLPLGLTFVNDGRLYSPHFYELALFQSPKTLGIGTILRFRARDDLDPPRPEQWGMELEYQHVLTEAELVDLFAAIDPTFPVEVKLLVRSPQQEQLAQQLEAAGSPLAARILRYSDVTVPGESEVYSEGLAAGRLKVIRRGEGGLESTRSSDILIMEDIPDFLPQCSGLITSVPQTALAHVNILAKNRGIPNAYRGGIVDEPEIDALARVFAPVIIKATAPDQLVVVAMTEQEFSQFRALTVVPPSAVPPVDLTDVVPTYDLQDLEFADEATWRPILGGKSTGFLALLSAHDVEMPQKPLGISIKPYVEHIEEMREQLQGMITDASFNADPLVRVLVLEGVDGFLAHPDADPTFPDDFLRTRPTGDRLRTIIEAGGVQGMIRQKPIDAATLATITAGLEENFGAYADEQGLRFRSSSNVEDAEGFNGAGLYTSNTGYLHADRLTGKKASATVEAAIHETWASYWGAEAFEERRLANVDHLSGSMGVAVHANFQDDFEIGNGVFTLTRLPPGHKDGAYLLELNAQNGALSVTNPPPGDPNLPEVDRIREDDNGIVTIERVRGSTLLPPGIFVLSDAQLDSVYQQAKRVVDNWLIVDNTGLPLSQQRSTLTIDFELREVADGWPAMNNGTVYPSRVVIKQARTLEPSVIRVPQLVRQMPIPVDVLARASRVEQRGCDTGQVRATFTEVVTDPRKAPDVGFAKAPFTSFVVLDFSADVPEVGAQAGQRRSAIHTGFVATHPGMAEGGPYRVDIDVDDAVQDALGFSRAAFDGTNVTIERAGVGTFSAAATCSASILFASPEDFLEQILLVRGAE